MLTIRTSATKYRLALLTLCASLLVTPYAAAGFFDSKPAGFGSASATGFLPVEQAFALEGRLKGTTLSLHWQVKPEHYLYRSRFKVQVMLPENAAITPLNIPRGQAFHDEFQGDVEILRDRVQLDYQLDLTPQQQAEGVVVNVTFQGCAEAGLCYPPHRQQLNLVQHQ